MRCIVWLAVGLLLAFGASVDAGWMIPVWQERYITASVSCDGPLIGHESDFASASAPGLAPWSAAVDAGVYAAWGSAEQYSALGSYAVGAQMHVTADAGSYQAIGNAWTRSRMVVRFWVWSDSNYTLSANMTGYVADAAEGHVAYELTVYPAGPVLHAGDFGLATAPQQFTASGVLLVGSLYQLTVESSTGAAGGFSMYGSATMDASLMLTLPQPPACTGDVDCDGQVALTDIDAFVEALNYPDGFGWLSSCPWASADCNGDGDVTFADIDAFVARIGHTCP